MSTKQEKALDALFTQYEESLRERARTRIAEGYSREDIVLFCIRINGERSLGILNCVADTSGTKLETGKLAVVFGAREQFRTLVRDTGLGLEMHLAYPPSDGCIVVVLYVNGQDARRELMVE